MTKILSLSNHKGGVGKTTSTINIGSALNQLNKKVLIIDLDPQSNLSLSLGVVKASNNIYGALRNEYEIKPLEIMKGFDLIPATIDLAGIEIELSTKMDREYYLKEIIDPIKDNYDYILIDCPPSLGLLTLNAFTASDEILIPLQSEFLAMHGLSELIKAVKLINRRLNPNLFIAGIFLTQFDSRKKLNKDVFKDIAENFPNELFTTKIRDNVALADAPSYKLDIFRFNPKSNGAEDYTELAKEIIKKHRNEINR
jgi:chromosome partitioning protein